MNLRDDGQRDTFRCLCSDVEAHGAANSRAETFGQGSQFLGQTTATRFGAEQSDIGRNTGQCQLAPDIKHTLVVEVNLAANPATINMYVDGLVYGGSNPFTSTQSAFAGTPSGALYLGNSTTAAAPLIGELDGALGYLSIDPAERAAVMSYLGGL